MKPSSTQSAEPGPVSLGPSPREIQVGLHWNIVAGMLAMIWLTLPGTPLTMLMECLGAEALLVGLLVSIQQFAMVLQIPGALLSGLFKQRKWLWAGLSMVHRLVWFAPVLFVISPRYTGITGMRLLLVMVAVSSVFAQLSVSTWHAWMADLIPESQRSRFWGTRQSLLWIVYTPAVLLFGYLLDIFPDPRHSGGNFNGFAIVFVLGSVAGCLDIIMHLKVPEPPAVICAIRRSLRERIASPFRNRDFTFLTAGMTVWYFNLGLIGSFSILFLTRKFGMNYSQLAILNFSSSLAVITGGLLWGFFIKRTGVRPFLISMLIVAPFFSFAWFLLRHTSVPLTLPWLGTITVPQPMLVLLITNFFSSLFYCGIGLCQMNLLSSLTPREDRGMAMAVHWTAIGLGSSIGPLLGGFLVDWFEIRFALPQPAATGFQFEFMHLLALMHAGIAWTVALPVFRRLRTTAGELPVGTTLSRLIVGNPLRLVGNILMMDTATTSRSRVRAVRGMGRQRFALAVTDLVEQLQNPASSVREAAVAALGRIGNRDAVSALVKVLGEPDAGLVLPLLHALRQAAAPAALPAVLPWLTNPNPEISKAAARAMGAFKDRRAVRPLIDILQSSSNPAIVAACAEALEMIGDPVATHAIVMRIPDIETLVTQRTLAVAAASLFSNRDTFYRLIENESRHPGTLCDALVEDLTDAILGCFLPVKTQAPVRLTQALRRRLAADDAVNALTVFHELTLTMGSALYIRPQPDATTPNTAAIAAQNERFGIIIQFSEHLHNMYATQTEMLQAETGQHPPDSTDPVKHSEPETALVTALPLAMYLLTTVLQEERRKKR